MKRLLFACLLLAGCDRPAPPPPPGPPPKPPPAPPAPQERDPRTAIRDPAERVFMALDMEMWSFGDAIRTFAPATAARWYHDGFSGTPVFAPAPADAAESRPMEGVVRRAWKDEPPAMTGPSAALEAFLKPIRAIEFIVFKFPAVELAEPRARIRMVAHLGAVLEDGGRLDVVEEYEGAFVHTGAWRIEKLKRVAGRRTVASRPAFVDVTEAAGLSLGRPERAADDRFRQRFASFGGVAVGDFDGDGRADLYFPASPQSRLYLNRGGGRFEDATDRWGLPKATSAAPAAALAIDYDNDGDLDLFQTDHSTTRVPTATGLVENKAPSLHLFRNEGGRFVEATEKAGLAARGPATSLAAADIEGDGDLDVFVCYYSDYPEQSDVLATLLPATFTDVRDGWGSQLWRNNGDGTFTETAKEAGVHDRGRGLACGFADYDGDGRPDLYVANDYGDNVLFRNVGGGKFQEVAAKANAVDKGMGMGVAWGDYDGDGDLDLHVSNLTSSAGKRILGRDALKLPPEARKTLLKMSRGNTLLRNRGDGTFEDVSIAAGVANAGWAWSNAWSDFDCDGDLDLYVVNGYISARGRADL
jgi:hypothetical protein